jgi:hypothetical protein
VSGARTDSVACAALNGVEHGLCSRVADEVSAIVWRLAAANVRFA